MFCLYNSSIDFFLFSQFFIGFFQIRMMFTTEFQRPSEGMSKITSKVSRSYLKRINDTPLKYVSQ